MDETTSRTTVASEARDGTGIRIGIDVALGSGVELGARIVIGDRSTIGPNARIGDDVRIGADVQVGAQAVIARQRDSREPPLVIQDGVVVGEGATIRTGLTIGRGASIAAGAIVAASVPCHARVSQDGSIETESVVATEELPGGARLVPFREFVDARGRLSVGETPRELPFVPRRIFIVDHVPEQTRRGGHAHRVCHQFLFCAGGSCVVMLDDGTERAVVVLGSVSMGLHVPPGTWASEERFAPGTQLVVLASDAYDADDYVHDYAAFTGLVHERG